MLETHECAKELISDLDSEIKWQWKWERLWRRVSLVCVLATWIVHLLMLALAFFQVACYGKTPPQLWVAFALAALSVLNIMLPRISETLRIQQRQETYDSHAREYSAIRSGFVTGTIDLTTAVEKFNRIRRLPTEAVIRKTT